jgi:hypothetical protein
MKFNLILWGLAIATVFISCESSKLKKDSEKKAKEFFALLKAGDEKRLKSLYSGFENFDTYYKSDSARINWSSEKDNVITVSIHNRFTNGFGKITEKDISLIFQKDSIGQLKIADSKGLTDFEDKNEYIFGINTGCIIKESDTTDQQIIKALEKANALMLDKALSIYMELKSQLRIVNWNWESGYGGSGSGKGIVRNGSTFSVPKLKYKVTYKTSSGDPITSDEGYITYDAIDAGESKSFTFYTSYIGNATKASIDLDFDEDLIYKYLAKKDWTGKECEEYFKKHPEKLKEL